MEEDVILPRTETNANTPMEEERSAGKGIASLQLLIQHVPHSSIRKQINEHTLYFISSEEC